MKQVTDKEFNKYGRVLKLAVDEFIKTITQAEPIKADTVVYEPSVPAFEKLDVFSDLQKDIYGDMPIEFGHCSGFNKKLNAVEYHRSSEIDIAGTDMILMLGQQQDIDYSNNTYNTKNVEMFFVPKGTAVELYATTLHFAPCSVRGKEFRCGVVLPKNTNEELSFKPAAKGEDRLLFAVNKWLIAHVDSGLQKDGAWIGLQGDNITVTD